MPGPRRGIAQAFSRADTCPFWYYLTHDNRPANHRPAQLPAVIPPGTLTGPMDAPTAPVPVLHAGRRVGLLERLYIAGDIEGPDRRQRRRR
jgi:hypothetical protein